MHQNQKIGFWPLASLVVGNLLGSAVFLLPATLASYGSISLVAWCVTACGAVILALLFSELGNRIPKSGGPYTFVTKAFGEELGFVIAWGYWIMSWISNSALLAGIAGYCALLVGDLSSIKILGIEIGVLVVVTWFNLLGIKTAGKGELVMTTMKLIPLVLIPLLGVFIIDMNNFPEFNLTEMSDYDALNTVAFITLWGFLGLETGTVPGGQVINPRKTVPLATITGTLVATFIYILGTLVTFGIVPSKDLANSSAPYAEAAAAVFGGSWGAPVAVMAILTCVGSLNGWTMIVGRIAQSAAEDGLFPKIFTRLNRDGTPVWAIIISSALTLPFVVASIDNNLVEQFNLVIDISVTFILFVYLACVIAYFKIVHTSKEWNIYRMTVGVVGLGFVIWALCATKPIMLLYSLIMACTGAPVWLYMRYSSREKRR